MNDAPVDLSRLVAVGDEISRTVRLTRADIVFFADLTHDRNPLHSTEPSSMYEWFGDVIASGEHTTSLLMGLAGSYFSRNSDGIKREMLALNFNFAFKAPVFADQDLVLRWRVSEVTWNSKLQGFIAQIDGAAQVDGTPAAVIGRGTVLVRPKD